MGGPARLASTYTRGERTLLIISLAPREEISHFHLSVFIIHAYTHVQSRRNFTRETRVNLSHDRKTYRSARGRRKANRRASSPSPSVTPREFYRHLFPSTKARVAG